MKQERRSLWSQTGPESKADTALPSWVASVRVSREGPRFRHLGATWQRVVRGRGAMQQAHRTHVVCHRGRSLPLGARQHCPAVGLGRTPPWLQAPEQRSSRRAFSSSVALGLRSRTSGSMVPKNQAGALQVSEWPSGWAPPRLGERLSSWQREGESWWTRPAYHQATARSCLEEKQVPRDRTVPAVGSNIQNLNCFSYSCYARSF